MSRCKEMWVTLRMQIHPKSTTEHVWISDKMATVNHRMNSLLESTRGFQINGFRKEREGFNWAVRPIERMGLTFLV